MELLPEGQKNQVDVLWEDQEKINKFSSLINEKDDLSEQLTKYKTEKDYLDDLLLEIELIDEDEKVQYKVGEVFIFLKVSKALKRIEKDSQVIDQKIEELESDIEKTEQELDGLKTKLYSKFGSNINLER